MWNKEQATRYYNNVALNVIIITIFVYTYRFDRERVATDARNTTLSFATHASARCLDIVYLYMIF